MRKPMICLSIDSRIASHSTLPKHQNQGKKWLKRVDLSNRMAKFPKDELLVWQAFLFSRLWTSNSTKLCWQVMPCHRRMH